MEKIRHHRLTPWLYYWVKERGYENRLPADLMQKLQQDFFQQLFLSSVQQKEVQEVLTALLQSNIEVILLKGADLGRRVYGDQTLRPMSDLDLLLAPEAIPGAKLALAKLGYQVYSMHREARLLINEILFCPPQDKILHVDLHWEIVAACSFYYLPYQSLRAEADDIDYFDTPVLVLSPEHTLIHLCLQAYEEQLLASQLLDLGLLIYRLPINWQKVQQEASRFGCQRPVYLVLQELAGLVPGKIPTALLDQLADYQPGWVERIVLRPRLRYLTLALPFFLRHRSLRQWLRFIGANLFPNREAWRTATGQCGRGEHLRQLLAKFLSKLSPEE